MERLDPQGHPGQYLSGDKWVPLQTITEVIKVAGSDPITEVVQLTNHGPIISSALAITPALGTSLEEQAFALQ